MWTWGANYYGQLGNGTIANTITEAPLPVVGLSGVVGVAAGDTHSVAVKSDGTVWTWGYNLNRQLGYETTAISSGTPRPIVGLSGVVAVAAGGAHSLALTSNGTVIAWGASGTGQLGNGVGGDAFEYTPPYPPVPVPGLSGVVAIAAAGDHSMALNQMAQCGHGGQPLRRIGQWGIL